jgi:hypothetical protein
VSKMNTLSCAVSMTDSFPIKIKRPWAFRPWPLGVDLMIGRYGSPKNNGRRLLCERQRRASPKRRDGSMIPMIALSLPDITLDTLSNPVLRRIRFWPIDIPCTLPGGEHHLNQIGAPVNLFLQDLRSPTSSPLPCAPSA